MNSREYMKIDFARRHAARCAKQMNFSLLIPALIGGAAALGTLGGNIYNARKSYTKGFNDIAPFNLDVLSNYRSVASSPAFEHASALHGGLKEFQVSKPVYDRPKRGLFNVFGPNWYNLGWKRSIGEATDAALDYMDWMRNAKIDSLSDTMDPSVFSEIRNDFKFTDDLALAGEARLKAMGIPPSSLMKDAPGGGRTWYEQLYSGIKPATKSKTPALIGSMYQGRPLMMTSKLPQPMIKFMHDSSEYIDPYGEDFMYDVMPKKEYDENRVRIAQNLAPSGLKL